jgi:hypothetical protein
VVQNDYRWFRTNLEASTWDYTISIGFTELIKDKTYYGITALSGGAAWLICRAANICYVNLPELIKIWRSLNCFTVLIFLLLIVTCCYPATRSGQVRQLARTGDHVSAAVHEHSLEAAAAPQFT